MTGLVRKATLFAACGVLAASAAFAGVPSPGNSSVPGCFSLVGSSVGVPDSLAGKFCVTVRDLANNPLNGSSVSVDISNASDLKYCDDQLNANYIQNCAAGTVRGFTDATGVACFTLLGSSQGAAATLGGGGRIYADGVLIGSPGVSAYDLDGAGGVGANDLSIWLIDFGSATPYGRSDYDCSGDVGANDLSLWLITFGGAASSESCLGVCP
jgi:pimeloyl-ACP methyl ester carboxylesterase